MIKSEYQILSRKIDEAKQDVKSVRHDISIISSDLTVDRQDIDEVKRRQGEIDSALKVILAKLNRIEQDQKDVIRDCVAAAIQEEVEPLRRTMNAFIKDKSKVLVMREKFNMFTTIVRFIRGTKNEFVKEIQQEEK